MAANWPMTRWRKTKSDKKLPLRVSKNTFAGRRSKLRNVARRNRIRKRSAPEDPAELLNCTVQFIESLKDDDIFWWERKLIFWALGVCTVIDLRLRKHHTAAELTNYIGEVERQRRLDRGQCSWSGLPLST